MTFSVKTRFLFSLWELYVKADLKMLHYVMRLLFCTNYSTARTNFYCTVNIEESFILTIFVRFSFFAIMQY